MRSLLFCFLLFLLFVFSGVAVADSESLDEVTPVVSVELDDTTPIDTTMMLAGINYLLERQNGLLMKQNLMIEYGVMMLSFLSGTVLAYVFIFGLHLR
jgi:hypothetical protein